MMHLQSVHIALLAASTLSAMTIANGQLFAASCSDDELDLFECTDFLGNQGVFVCDESIIPGMSPTQRCASLNLDGDAAITLGDEYCGCCKGKVSQCPVQCPCNRCDRLGGLLKGVEIQVTVDFFGFTLFNSMFCVAEEVATTLVTDYSDVVSCRSANRCSNPISGEGDGIFPTTAPTTAPSLSVLPTGSQMPSESPKPSSAPTAVPSITPSEIPSAMPSESRYPSTVPHSHGPVCVSRLNHPHC